MGPWLASIFLSPSAAEPAAPPEAKASRAHALIALIAGHRPQWTPRDYAALAREGYQRNAVAHRCVRLVAQAVGEVRFTLIEGGREIAAHPLTDLLAQPNPRLSGAGLMEALAAHLMIAGNAYVEAVALGGELRELHVLRPDRMRVVPGADGWAEAYEYTAGGRSVRFVQEGVAASHPACRAVQPARRPLRRPAAGGGAGGAGPAQRRRRLEQGAAGQFRPALRRPRLWRRRQPVGRAVRPAEGGAGGELLRLRQCRAAAAAGRRARLAASVAVAEGHGFPRGEERRGARDRARLRRAAHAARHSRRCHLRQLQRGEPGALAPDRAAAGAPAGPGARLLAGTGLRHGAASLWSPTSTRWRR